MSFDEDQFTTYATQVNPFLLIFIEILRGYLAFRDLPLDLLLILLDLLLILLDLLR